VWPCADKIEENASVADELEEDASVDEHAARRALPSSDENAQEAAASKTEEVGANK
jgi:hypothetical protein